MAVEEMAASLFPSDLFIQPNDQPAIVTENLGADMCRWYQAAGLFGSAEPVLRVVGRVERLASTWVHPMHGGSLTADALAGYTTAQRTLLFTFERRLFGRLLDGPRIVSTTFAPAYGSFRAVPFIAKRIDPTFDTDPRTISSHDRTFIDLDTEIRFCGRTRTITPRGLPLTMELI
jgi:hypothetical protein